MVTELYVLFVTEKLKLLTDSSWIFFLHTCAVLGIGTTGCWYISVIILKYVFIYLTFHFDKSSLRLPFGYKMLEQSYCHYTTFVMIFIINTDVWMFIISESV